MHSQTLRSAVRESLAPLVAILAIVGGFGIMRLAAVTESYALLVFSFVLMVGGLVMLFFRQRHGDDWSDA